MCTGFSMFDLFAKFRSFLVSDTSGAVTPEWTVLTALLVLSMSASIGTMAAGIHIAAAAIEENAALPANGTVFDLSVPNANIGG